MLHGASCHTHKSPPGNPEVQVLGVDPLPYGALIREWICVYLSQLSAHHVTTEIAVSAANLTFSTFFYKDDYPWPYLPTLMSSTTTSLPNFQSILDAALDGYAKQTGIDLTKHPSAKLQDCRSPDDVLQLFSERESAFKDYRDRYRNIINHVRPVVQVVHAFSALLGEAAGLVSSGIQSTLSDRIFMPYQVPFQPTKAIFVGIDVLLSVHISILF